MKVMLAGGGLKAFEASTSSVASHDLDEQLFSPRYCSPLLTDAEAPNYGQTMKVFV